MEVLAANGKAAIEIKNITKRVGSTSYHSPVSIVLVRNEDGDILSIHKHTQRMSPWPGGGVAHLAASASLPFVEELECRVIYRDW